MGKQDSEREIGGEIENLAPFRQFAGAELYMHKSKREVL